MLNGRGKKLMTGKSGARAVLTAATDRVANIQNPQVRKAAQLRLRQYVAAKLENPKGPAQPEISRGVSEGVRGTNGRRMYVPTW